MNSGLLTGLFVRQVVHALMEVTMSTEPSSHHLEVPGGRLYYEVRGSGPLLMVIGQPMTSAPFAPLADLLAEDHTVVTYDPHGLGASITEDPSREVTPEVQADGLATSLTRSAMGSRTCSAAAVALSPPWL